MKAHASAAAVMAAFLFCAPQSSPAHAETALPITITAQGIYCLKKNLNVNLSASTSAAITINAGNVTIDFNGFRVNNQAPLTTNQAIGVFAQDRKNITLRNGFIRGFYYGVALRQATTDASSSHVVEGMKVADSGYTGIFVTGNKSVIRDNRVLDTGGGLDDIAYGIDFKSADDGLVADNTVAGVSETRGGIGVLIQNSQRPRVTGNEVVKVDGGSQLNRAVAILDADDVFIINNRLLNSPGTGTEGIYNIGSSFNIICRDNEAAGFSATPFSACVVSVDNVIFFH